MRSWLSTISGSTPQDERNDNASTPREVNNNDDDASVTSSSSRNIFGGLQQKRNQQNHDDAKMNQSNSSKNAPSRINNVQQHDGDEDSDDEDRLSKLPPSRMRSELPSRGGTTSSTSKTSTATAQERAAPTIRSSIFNQLHLRSADAEMERRVSIAARNFGEGVQRIVMSAKMGSQHSGQGGEEWKARLLSLLGGSDADLARGRGGESPDIDELLSLSTTHDRFVAKCVEHDLTTNLIHCLRLLRVLELQQAHAPARGGKDVTNRPLSTEATSKVAQLLCMLCMDPSVGEQLRPHLLGLLSLVGASYPPSGVHIASAASSVISSFCENCLSTSLVWFLHDRKMVVHMTDDAKELCGMTTNMSGGTNRCLYGASAEKAGLWISALRTVVSLVTFSCNYQCTELLKDFDASGGYHVLSFAIARSSEGNVQKLLELVTMLVCCKTDTTSSSKSTDLQESADGMFGDSKYATNADAFEIVEDLMIRSIPYLSAYAEAHDGHRPVLTLQNIKELAAISVNTAKLCRDTATSTQSQEDKQSSSSGFDLASVLLVTTLQLYTDHSTNYSIIETKYNILAYYILAFPTFNDVSLKVMILKTLEYVVTGLVESDFVKPLSVATEVCFALIINHLTLCAEGTYEAKDGKYESLLSDCEMLCGTLVKLLQFDESAGILMVEGGLLDEKINLILNFISSVNQKEKGNKMDLIIAPYQTDMDRAYIAVCDLLKPVVSNFSNDANIASPSSQQVNLGVLLASATKNLGDEASFASLSVLEAVMCSRSTRDILQDDVSCLMSMIEEFSNCVKLRIKAFRAMAMMSNKAYPIFVSKEALHADAVRRAQQVFTMFKTVLETNELSHSLFQTLRGFEIMITMLQSLKNTVPQELPPPEETQLKGSRVQVASIHPVVGLIKSMFGVLSASTIGSMKHRTRETTIVRPSSKDIEGESLTPIPHVMSSVELNCKYLLQVNFYRDFSKAIAETGILHHSDLALQVVNLSLALLEPTIHIDESLSAPDPNANPVDYLYNPDATRLVLMLAMSVPPQFKQLAKRALDEILRLCASDMTGSTLSQIASSGLTRSLTSKIEFTLQLEDRTHPLYSRFVLLLRRVTAFHMSYVDFVALLRCIAGPILQADSPGGRKNKGGRVELPVISSSIETNHRKMLSKAKEDSVIEYWKINETDICTRLETLAVIASKGDRVSRCKMGGDNLNTVALYMQKVPVKDRLFKLCEEGSLKFIQVKCADSSSSKTSAPTATTIAATPSSAIINAEKVWPLFVTCGFTYCLWIRLPPSIGEFAVGTVFLLDLSSPDGGSSSTFGGSNEFFSLWYDLHHQQFCILTSAASRNEPVKFSRSPLLGGVWHHILITYIPPKRPILSRKALVSLYIDGRPLDSEVKVENPNIPPNATIYIGAPNPFLAASGTIRGSLPEWELGPNMMMSSILTIKEATAIFSAGPDFEGMFWGDRPQRLSLTATATTLFAMLAEIGGKGSVAGALRRRNVPEVEAAGHVTREKGAQDDTLASVGLLCYINPEELVFGFRASACNDDPFSSQKLSRRLTNIARIYTNENVSSDAFIYGKDCIIIPGGFADNVRWIGGPNFLMPLVNAVQTSSSLALSLRLVRESVRRHPANLESLHSGGGYRILGLLLRQKQIINAAVLDQCFAFAVHGFDPGSANDSSRQGTDHWVLTDLDAMKYLLLNHQVWDMRRNGPDLPMRLLFFLNNLVAANSAHAAFNSRRLHLLGIVRWTLHLMLEAAELYDIEFSSYSDNRTSAANSSNPKELIGRDSGDNSSVWKISAPTVSNIAVGGDPGNTLLHGCKSLLRRVLTYMLTPDDLEALAGVTIYTLSISNYANKPDNNADPHNTAYYDGDAKYVSEDEKLPPGPVARIYLVRLLEELVVDGVNEIVSANIESNTMSAPDGRSEGPAPPHAGGVTSSNPSYLSTAVLVRGRQRRQQAQIDAAQHPKHQQAQAFLSAFAGILTPAWFACVLEGSREEASASAALRLMMLMLQSSPSFANAFEAAGGFSPMVLSIPKFSTCPSIVMSMLSQLLHAPVLHLPCFSILDAAPLCEVFDLESDSTELVITESLQGGLHMPSDPSCGIFALLAECLGRNIQLASYSNPLGAQAKLTNEAVIKLLGHRHTFSSSFQEFCRTPDFLEPLAQALCLVHDQKIQRMIDNSRTMMGDEQQHSDNEGYHMHGGYSQNSNQRNAEFTGWSNPQGTAPKQKRRGSLADADRDNTPTERFIGENVQNAVTGIGMVQLLRLVLSHAVLSGPYAATLLAALFRSFPIHATLDQVEAFHLILIEHCRGVIEDALQRGEPIALANCVGVSSVLLDRLMAGFFTSEPVLETVQISLSTLKSLTSPGTYAARTLANSDQTHLVADAAHLARLTCLTALHRSRPSGPYDEGDDDLKLAVLKIISKNLRQLLIVPGGSSSQGRRQGSSPVFIPPQPGSRYYSMYQSASLARCCPPNVTCTYPDLTSAEQPDRAFVVALMSQVYNLLLDRRHTVREQAVSIVISLLQQRRGFMSELLITDIPRGESRMETVDLMNRGGFGALMVAHEAASIADNVHVAPRRAGNGGTGSSKLKYVSFFEWLDRNHSQISAVFHGIHIQASRLLPGIGSGAATPEEAIENEQKVMLLKLTSQDSSDRTIQGGIKRAELAENLHEKTIESHALWRRQGFDDLSSGAMLWKNLLRQLKGSHSIWEGGFECNDCMPLAIRDKQKSSINSISLFRWKLDLTEGYERQRRRLLPNYEFNSLYNIDETECTTDVETEMSESNPTSTDDTELAENERGAKPKVSIRDIAQLMVNTRRRTSFVAPAENSMEATTALLREMKIKAGTDFFEEDDDDIGIEEGNGGEYDNEDSGELDNENNEGKINDSDMSMNRPNEVTSDTHGKHVSRSGRDSTDFNTENDAEETEEKDEEAHGKENSLASSYDLITGLLEAGDWPEKSYNVRRCTGLEVRKGLLLWCREAIYIVDGFEQTEGDGLEGKINRLQMSSSTYYVNIRSEGGVALESAESQQVDPRSSSAGSNKNKEDTRIAGDEITYQHRSQRIAFSDIYSVYRRRYQLQQHALEFYDVHRNGTLVAFLSTEEREEVLSKVLQCPLPNSIFSSSSMSGTTSINYNKFMNNLRAKITNQWVNGRMTNYEFIMHLNSFAGRSYNDLTQYPVFPWILCDYDSEEIDLEDPSIYRDLSHPMGAQSEARAIKFQDRYESLEEAQGDDGHPPFHYGTHYSCAAYVLHYLMRLEPFSRLALSLQGGRFDVADRLFQDVGSSYRSAAHQNDQDVRELIPEFFYLPEFLANSNNFDYGMTQSDKIVHDVVLPKWAKGDPSRFIRINRLAMESEFVSRNLHNWIDLIFGFKQRGREAVKALNMFVHVTYEGQVDIDKIEDPVEREATIAQIQNFGQTPSRLERKPFPQRNIFVAAKEKSIDFSALYFLAPLTPPYCIVGAPHRVYLRVSMWDTCRVGMSGQSDSSVGDMFLLKGQLMGVGRTCALILPSKKYYRFGLANNGVSVHVAVASKNREVNRVVSIHDGMHRAPISTLKPSLNGEWLVSGCTDATVRVWKYSGQKVILKATLCGHEGGKITCIEVSTTFGVIVTGGADGNVLVWDLRKLSFVRHLYQDFDIDDADKLISSKDSVISVSINHKNGNILTLVGTTLSLYDINGNLLGTQPSDTYGYHNRPTCAVATSCPEWMEDGIVAVSGHINGDVMLWSLSYNMYSLIMRHMIPDKVHTSAITALRVAGETQDTLLIGDSSGKMSVCKTLRLDCLNQHELSVILKEIQSKDANNTEVKALGIS